jgi:hypothetical protein
MVWQRQMEITDTIVDVLLGMLHRTEISLPYRKCVRVLKQGRFGNTCHLW